MLKKNILKYLLNFIEGLDYSGEDDDDAASAKSAGSDKSRMSSKSSTSNKSSASNKSGASTKSAALEGKFSKKKTKKKLIEFI